jgi:[CysO sulfur-carrier protein]-S-L-cysteine hydrolase
LDPVASKILLFQEHWDQMRSDVIDRAPLEACGLVAGRDNRSLKVFTISNSLQSPIRFKLDPQEQLDALLSIEDNGWDLLAIYHSHPAGPPYPSPIDVTEAAYPEAVNLIWYPHQGDWSCRGYSIQAGAVTEITLEMIEQA